MLFVILLTVQILIGLALVGLILIQRSEGGALGIGGGGGGGFMSARGAGNFLTKATSILAIGFFANCIALTIVSNLDRAGTSVIDKVGAETLTLDETTAAQNAAAASAAANQTGAAQVSKAAPSLTELPAPTTTAPSLGSVSASSTSSAAASQ